MTALRGYIQGQNAGVGTSLAWPSGTVAGDLCWLHTGGSLPQSGPQSSGWTPVGHKAWWKILDSSDLAGPLVVTAERVKVAVFFGADRIGATSQQASIRVGADDWMVVDASRRSGSCTPDDTYRLGDEWVSVTGNTQATLTRAAPGAGTLSIPITSGTEAFAYQVVTESLPSAPTLITPTAGQRISAADLPRFAWRHRGGTHIYSIVELVGPMGTRTIKSDGTLHTGEWHMQRLETITLQASLAAGSYTWRAYTENHTGQGPWSSPVAFVVDVPPSIGTITVTSPAESLTPRVVATPTAGYGSVEQTRVTIAPAGSTDPERDAIWSSGIEAGSAVDETASPSAPWTNGASVRAWVTVWQTGGVSTTASSAPFAVSWTPTPTPEVSLAAGSPPTVTVTGLAAGRRVEIQQDLGDGWSRLTARLTPTATVTVGSPLLATGEVVQVRARQSAQVSGVWLWSDWATAAPVTFPPVGCYLVDDADRSDYLEAHISEEGARGIVQGIGVSYGLGGGSARVDRTPEAGQSGDLTLIAGTTAEVDAIRAWLSARAVFWYAFPPEGAPTRVPQRAVRMRRVSPLTTQRLAQSSLLQHRLIPLSWVEAPQT